MLTSYFLVGLSVALTMRAGMHLAKISNVPVLFLVLFSFDFSCLCALWLISFCLCEASGMLQFSIQWLLLSNISFASASFQIHLGQSK